MLTCALATHLSMCVPSWVGNGCGLACIKVRAFHLNLSHYVCNTNGPLCSRFGVHGK